MCIRDSYGDASKRTMDQFPDTFDIFRYGGDEFTAIMYENETSKVSTMTETFTKEIHKTEFPYFAQFGIDPHLSLDIGTARFDEGVRAFTDLLQSIQAYNEQCADTTEHITIPPGKRMRAFLDLWMNIADERAIIQKAETRIEKLQEYKIKQPPIHKNIIDILRKGALHITDETLRVLPQDSDIIKFYVLETRKKNHKNSQEQPDVVTLLEKFSDDVIQKNVIEPELEKFMSINYIDTLYPTDSR